MIRYDMIWFDRLWYDIIYDITWYDLILYAMIWYNIWFDTIWYNIIWYDITWYDMIWYDMIWYNMIWYNVIWYMIWCDIYIYITAIELPPGGSSTVHIYTQTIYRTTQSTQTLHRTTQFTNQEECGPCPVIARYTLAFAVQLRKKQRKTSDRVAGECQLARWKGEYTEQSVHNNKNI